jgi:hypothetical protein
MQKFVINAKFMQVYKNDFFHPSYLTDSDIIIVRLQNTLTR